MSFYVDAINTVILRDRPDHIPSRATSSADQKRSLNSKPRKEKENRLKAKSAK